MCASRLRPEDEKSYYHYISIAIITWTCFSFHDLEIAASLYGYAVRQSFAGELQQQTSWLADNHPKLTTKHACQSRLDIHDYAVIKYQHVGFLQVNWSSITELVKVLEILLNAAPSELQKPYAASSLHLS